MRLPLHVADNWLDASTLTQLLNINPPEWARRGVCAQTDPDMFYPHQGEHARAARQVCAGCPVRDECLDWALTHHERWGIWGGFTARERRGMRGGGTAA